MNKARPERKRLCLEMEVFQVASKKWAWVLRRPQAWYDTGRAPSRAKALAMLKKQVLEELK